MLSKDERQKLQEQHDAYLKAYQGKKEASDFKGLLLQHRYYIAAKKHLLLDDVSVVLHDTALDNDQVMERVVDIVRLYVATLEEKP